MCGTTARKVKVQSTTGERIHVFELEAYSLGGNIAVGKQATQSSTPRADDGTTYNTYDSSRAVDGSKSTFSETDANDSSPWLEVDLGEQYSIEHVQLLNRYCIDQSDPSDCLCRLSNANLSLLDDRNQVVATKSLGDTCGVLNIGISFVDKPSCPQNAFVVNSVTTSEPSDPHTDDSGSPAIAIIASIIGLCVVIVGATLRYKRNKKILEHQRRDGIDDTTNMITFVRDSTNDDEVIDQFALRSSSGNSTVGDIRNPERDLEAIERSAHNVKDDVISVGFDTHQII